jgi:putative aminopeptidase FrvX
VVTVHRQRRVHAAIAPYEGEAALEQRALEFLRQLLDAPGPSGFESRPATIWRREAATFADEIDRDVLGNSYARLARPDAPVVIIEGHIDEIGLMITHIDDEGYLWFDRIGGWDAQVLIGQRVKILGKDSDVVGIIGRRAAHILTEEEKSKVPNLRDMWIDIGAKDRNDAKQRVEFGDSAVIDAEFRQLTDDFVVACSLDNRVGAFVALEALRRLSENRPPCDVYALAATQEETSYAGAATATFRLAPVAAIVIDVTHSTDYPSADKKRGSEIKLGGGPVLSRGPALNPIAYQKMVEVARESVISVQVQGAPRSTDTDADAMFIARSGTSVSLVSIPNRYMHSPNETVSLSDLDSAAKLIADYVAAVTPAFDFRP